MTTFARFKDALLKFKPTDFHSKATPFPEFEIPELNTSKLKTFYAPFDYVNANAKLVLVGITPGAEQMNRALLAACQSLHAGHSDKDVLQQAKLAASFSGGMRNVLYGLLDKYRINEYLGIESCEELWGESNHDVHFTSTLRNPTFIAKDLKNYTGGSPVALDKHPLLKRHIQTLAVELNASKDSLIIPLGEKVVRVIQMMVDEKLLPLSRVLNFEGRVAEFPHPSKSNKESVNLAMLDELPEQADYVKEMWDDYVIKMSKEEDSELMAKSSYEKKRISYYVRATHTRNALNQLMS
jgi:hypothetical protein